MISICDRLLISRKSEQLWPSSAWVNSESHGGEDVAVYAEGPWVGSFFLTSSTRSSRLNWRF